LPYHRVTRIIFWVPGYYADGSDTWFGRGNVALEDTGRNFARARLKGTVHPPDPYCEKATAAAIPL